MSFDFGSIAASLDDELDEAIAPVLAWWQDPVGPPPMVTIEQNWLLPSSHDYRWKKRPVVWPIDLIGRPLILISASGGIDSTAAAIAVRRKWPRAMLLLERSDTGREPSDSEAVLRRLSRTIGAPVVTMAARNELFDLIRWKALIPNTVYGDWCTGDLKGTWLDRLNYWLAAGRRPGTTRHTLGYLWGEGPEARPIRKALSKRGGRNRVRMHMQAQLRKFGPEGEQIRDGIEEFVILHDLKIDKDGETRDPRVPANLRGRGSAIDLIRSAGLPISRVYLDRTRHGCIPCKWWDERLWLAYFWTDPDGFEQAAQLEEEIFRNGSTNPASKYHGSERPPVALRTWLLPKVKNATKDDGRTLRQWVEHWRDQGLLERPPAGLGLVRAEDLGDVDPGDRTVHLPTFREGRRNRTRPSYAGDIEDEEPVIGRRVAVYLNLNKPGRWTVAEVKGRRGLGKVIGYARTLHLTGVIANVQPGGREATRRQKRKRVHAWLIGTVAAVNGPPPRWSGIWEQIRYNPYTTETFVGEDGRRVDRAEAVFMDAADHGKVVADRPSGMSNDEIPQRDFVSALGAPGWVATIRRADNGDPEAQAAVRRRLERVAAGQRAWGKAVWSNKSDPASKDPTLRSPLNRRDPLVLAVALDAWFGKSTSDKLSYIEFKHQAGRITDLQAAAVRRELQPRGRANTHFDSIAQRWFDAIAGGELVDRGDGIEITQLERWARRTPEVPPVLDAGGTRLVFDLGDTVLKVPMSPMGKSDNRTEATIWKQGPPHIRRHLVPVLDSHPSGNWLVMPKVRTYQRGQRFPDAARITLEEYGILDHVEQNYSARNRMFDYALIAPPLQRSLGLL